MEAASDDAGHAVAVATDARPVVAEGDRFDPVDGAQIVEVLRSRPLEAAFVGAQKRLADAGHRFAVAFEQRADLFDDVGQGDAMSEPVRFNASCPKMRGTLFVNLLGDSG
ncbi:hypothetical protein [Sphaerisporangium aureirubrum]|uniref:hypothetical protein n=1 Tax=Sphaerisporangium aureirubrum TaxID=1544736 RepID=UPI003632E0DA